MTKRNKKFIIIFSILALILLGFGFYYFLKNEQKISESNNVYIPDNSLSKAVNNSVPDSAQSCTQDVNNVVTCVPTIIDYQGINGENDRNNPNPTPFPTPTPTPTNPTPTPTTPTPTPTTPTPTPTKDVNVSYVMESSNYRMQSDSINSGGGMSSSSNYALNDTVGEIGTGQSSSDGKSMNGGYWQMQEFSIILTSVTPISVDMGVLNDITGGTVTGEATWNVLTDIPAGYSLNIKALSDPAMQSINDQIENYTPTSIGTPDFTWSVASNEAEFGYSAYGTDVTQLFRHNSSNVCNAGSNATLGKCWMNFTTTDTEIAHSQYATHPDGTNTTVLFKAQSNTHALNPGAYQAVIRVTAMSN